MGACFDKPMVRVGTKVIKKSRLKELRTYQDAIRIAGYECHPNAMVLVVQSNISTMTPVVLEFKIVDGLVFKGSWIPIARLYGRPS